MVNQATVIDVLIASPSDLQSERDRIPLVFLKWNTANDGVHLSPVMWEASGVPELGDHPQHALDRRLIPQSELLVAMFWSKIGTATPTAPSGTIEEIREFIRLKGAKRVMLYFCDRPMAEGPGDIDTTAIALLQEFKSDMRTQGLYASYTSIEELEALLYHNLDIKVEELLSGELPLPETTAVTVPVTPEATWYRTDHPDERLRQPVAFGTALVDISRGFDKRMDEFDNVDGATNDKFLALGAHVFNSVAFALDDLMARRPYDVPVASRNAIRSISVRLKQLACNSSSYLKRPWGELWDDGRVICHELVAIADRAPTGRPDQL